MKYPTIILVTTFFAAKVLVAQSNFQTIYFTNDEGGNRTQSFVPCDPSKCPGNLLSNPGYESWADGWWTENATVTSVSHSGTSSMLVCDQNSGGAGQIVEAMEKVQYHATVFATTLGQTKCEIGLRFLDEHYQKIGLETTQSVNSPSFTQYELEAISPQGTKFVEVWFWKSAGECLLVDDWCLLLNDHAINCPGNLLANGDFHTNNLKGWKKNNDCAVVKGSSYTCIAAGGGAEQLVTADPGKVYVLKCMSKVTETGFDAFISMQFLDSTMAPIGNRYAHLVYKTAWELHTLSGFSPEQARYIRVWFYKIGGTGCFSTDDWCLTEMEARERSNSEQGSGYERETHLHGTGSIILFPNPAQTRVSIGFYESVASAKSASLVVIDLMGVTHKSLVLSQRELQIPYTLNLEGLPSGFYYVVLTPEGEHKITKRLVIANR